MRQLLGKQGSAKLASTLGSGLAVQIGRIKRRRAIGVAAAVMIAGLSAPAQAQEAAKPPSSNGWIVTIGGTVEYGPSYAGANHYSFSGLPSFDIRRLGEPVNYGAPDDSIDYDLFDFGGVEIGPVVGYRGGRSPSDDWRLEGLNNVQWNIDAGAYAQYWPVENRLRLRAEVRQALWGGDGLIADLGMDWFQPVTDSLVLSAGPRVSLANSTYMRNNFGISQSESAANGSLPAFNAQGGIEAVGFTVGATYTISPAWNVQLYDRYDRLVGDAAESPITSDIGSKNQNVIGFELNYSFQVAF